MTKKDLSTVFRVYLVTESKWRFICKKIKYFKYETDPEKIEIGQLWYILFFGKRTSLNIWKRYPGKIEKLANKI